MNRNYFAAVALLPGVQFTPSNQMGNDTIIASGQSQQGNNVTVDGGYNADDALGATAGAQVRTPIEAIQEFQVLTSMYDAEYGRASGVVVNAVTKSGTNQFKGVAFLSAASNAPDVQGLPGQTGQPDETDHDEAGLGRRPRRAGRPEQGALLRQPRAAGGQSDADAGLSDAAVARLLDGRRAIVLEHDAPLRPPDQRDAHVGGPVPEGDGAAVPHRGESSDARIRFGRDRHRRDAGRHVDQRVRQRARQHRSASPGRGNTGGTATRARAPSATSARVRLSRCPPQLDYLEFLDPGQHGGARSVGLRTTRSRTTSPGSSPARKGTTS